MSNSWGDEFNSECLNSFSSQKANLLISKYSDIFPSDYQYNFSPKAAVQDLEYIEETEKSDSILHKIDSVDGNIVLKIFSRGGKLTLSDTMPLLENLGFKVLEEQAYKMLNRDEFYVHYYSMIAKYQIEDFKKVKPLIEEALFEISSGKTIADHLSQLITFSGISWRDIDLIRTLSHYLHQTGFIYDDKYVGQCLIKHFEYTKNLINLFNLKFNPECSSEKEAEILSVARRDFLSNVQSSAEDKVLRTILVILEASLRTNYFQKHEGEFKDYISIKFNSSKVPNLPSPIPYAEIFVYSKDFEGIHIRGGKVARGGIRWSDRGEDYRTEVFGLMKAQMTKNAVIVPDGSKGGFYTRFSSDEMSREEYMKRAIACYQNFLRGLLDITDNIINDQIITPKDVIIYDEHDPYLVVAADKGTATFSDHANRVSEEYGFWLGDAFASGGSAGYDHKKMGITAKGAWISVQRHFKEIGIDVQKDEITVVGIGDMSGDVFGNGMLLSKSVKLVAAFNHMHIFIDPNPNPKESYLERKRLFDLPGSKWSDYYHSLISQGGGIFERKAKIIPISKEMKDLFDIEEDELAPDDLVNAILKSKVDLIWNGGIGTYVKSSSEEKYAKGDQANDNLRINGKDLRARVIGEGGNLGMSQRGRIEYARNGGRLNTDFIDNSAGVDCSDHEVNIKIALRKALVSKKLSLEARNELLAKMTDEVAELVLEDNKVQTQAISIMENSSIFNVESFSRLITLLEEEKLLNRNVEFIPSDAELAQRVNNGEKLTRPELAVLLSYSKRSVYNELATSKLPEDDYFNSWLLNYFPKSMRDDFKDEILSHPLKKEIILTVITNKLVNQLSGPILSSLKRETGALLCDIVRGFVIVQEIFDLNSLWNEVDLLPKDIPFSDIMEIYTDINKVIRRGIAWMITNLEHPLKINPSISTYRDLTLSISDMLINNLFGSSREKFELKYKKYTSAGIPSSLAEKCAKLESLVSAFDIASISKDTGENPEDISRTYFRIGNMYNIDWLRKTCDKLMTESYWQRLSLQSLKDDMFDKQRRIIKLVIKDKKLNKLDEWFESKSRNSQIFINFMEGLMKQENIDISMLILANKKLEMFIRKI